MRVSVYLTVIFGLAMSVTGYAAAEQPFALLTCKMGECVWYRPAAKVDIQTTDIGQIVGATIEECVTQHKGDYPASYQCQPFKTTRQDYVAHCSTLAPSIAFKNDKGQWERTHLSISEDAEFGYNRSSIDLYLRICHDHLRKAESLDMLAAKFGYRSRAKEIEGKEQDTVNSIADLRFTNQVKSDVDSVKVVRFRTPSKQIHCMFVTSEGKTEPTGIACDINQSFVRIPIRPRPSDCEGDWGQRFELGNESDAGLECASDWVGSDDSPILAYGNLIKLGKISCSSEETGLTCKNANGRGFFLSRRAQRLF